MKLLARAGSSRACMEAKINTAISEQDLSGVQFFSEVTEEQLHLSGEIQLWNIVWDELWKVSD